MSSSVSGSSISLTRGDTLRIKVNLTDPDGNEYTPVEDDRILFTMKKAVKDEEPLLVKEIPYDTCILIIEPQDTKNLDFGKYVYDMEIQFSNGDVDTFITVSSFTITQEVG